MTQLRLTISILGAATAMVLSSAFISVPVSGGPCGTFRIGDYSVDVSKADHSIQVASTDLWIENVRAGISYVGTAECTGTFEITGMDLHITTAKEEVSYHYDFDMIRKMQTMETYMLVRYFNDAEVLHFTGIRVRNDAGETFEVPEVMVILAKE